MTELLDLPIHPVTGLSALAVLGDRPVWPVLGGATDDEDDDDLGIDLNGGGKQSGRQPDVEDDEDLDDEDEDTGEKGDKADEDDWKPPTKEEWKKVQDALATVNAEAKRHRLRLRELRKNQRSAEQQADRSGAADDDALARARQEAVEEAQREFKPVAVRAAAIAALTGAKFRNPTDGRIDRMVARLDMDDIEVDLKTGRVLDGLDEQIEELKEDFPELFGDPEPEQEQQQGRRPRAPRINAADKKAAPPEPKTTGEKHMARLGLR